MLASRLNALFAGMRKEVRSSRSGDSALGDFAARQVGGDRHESRGDADPDPDLALVAAAQIAECEADSGFADSVVDHFSPSPRSRIRCAIRDCSDQSSMKPGEAFWSKRPPDSEKLASSAS